MSVDGFQYHDVDSTLWGWPGQNPLAYSDPSGNSGVYIDYPDYEIKALGQRSPDLGHAGVLLVDDKTGQTSYFEYGRYDAAGLGLVQKVTVPNVMIGKDGRPTDASLKSVLRVLAAKYHGRVRGAYVKDADYKKSRDYAMKRMAQNSNPNRNGYGLLTNNCGDFAQDTLEAGGADLPSKVDPRPDSYIDEMADDFPDFDFTPGKGGGNLTWHP